LPLNSNPTCGEVVEFMSVNDGDLSQAGCSALQEYQGYCGCPAIPVKNECSFCPNGGTPFNPDKVISDVFTCQGLYDFVSFLRMDECGENASDFKQIQAFAYVCGCPDVQPSCTLCPAGIDPPSATKLADSNEGTACGEYAEFVASLTENECTSQQNEIRETASVCGCGWVVTTPEIDDGVPSSTPPPPTVQDDDFTEILVEQTKSKKTSKNLVIIIAVIVPVVLALLTVVYYFYSRKSTHRDSKFVANPDGTENEGHRVPVEGMEGSLSMSDIQPPPESFSLDENETPVNVNPEHKIV
jgi:hypothetical protein